MTPQELKNSILQLAIQGKLVEQRPEEGTAAELLEKILAAKNAKGAKGNLTRSRRGAENMSGGSRSRATGSRVACRVPSVPEVPDVSSVPPIPDDEKPFDIPESWEWVRHNALFEIVGGSQPPKSKFRDTPQEGYVRLYQIRDYGERPVPVYVPTKMVSKFTQKGGQNVIFSRFN